MAINRIIYDTSGEAIVDNDGYVTVYGIDGASNRVNKVQYGQTVLLDVTDTTAEASDVALGETFYTKDGVKRTGTKSDASSMNINPSTASVTDDVLTIIGGGTANLGTKSITSNGTYDAESDGYDGYSEVTVNVQPSLQNKTVTSNGTYTADSGYDALESVTVNVSGSTTWATGTFTPVSATTSVTFDTTLTTIHGILIVPTSATPFSFSARTQVGMIVTPDCYYQSISLHSNSGGTGFQTPTASTTNSRMTQNGTSVTITAPYNFRELSYTWFAW